MVGTQDAVEYSNTCMLCGQQHVEVVYHTHIKIQVLQYQLSFTCTFRLNPERPAADLKEAYNMTAVDDQHVSLAILRRFTFNI